MRIQILVAGMLLTLLGIVGIPEAPAQESDDTIVSAASANVATDVINGTVLAMQSVDTGSAVHSLALVRVDEAIEGDLSGDIFVEVPGGTSAGGLEVTVSHQPSFRVSDVVQLALLRATAAEEAVLTGGASPVYSVVGGIDGAAAVTGSLLSQANAAGDFTLTGAKWDPSDSSRWPIRYRINPANSGLSAADTVAALQGGFEQWVDDPATDIEFEYLGTTNASPSNFSDGSNTLGWVTTGAADQYLAQAIWATQDGTTVSFDIRFNRDYQWAYGAQSGHFDVETVNLHEVGHAIGLGHTTASTAEVMYPSISSNRTKGLGVGDLSGVASLYPAGNPPPVELPEVGSWPESRFVPVTPCAVLDTRFDANFGAGLLGGSTLRAQLTGPLASGNAGHACGGTGVIPQSAVAVMINVVAVEPFGSGNLRITGSGSAASGGVVNFVPGQTNSNAVPVGITAEGAMDIYVNAPVGVMATHVRVVALGYFEASNQGSFVPVVPCAVYDSRTRSPVWGQQQVEVQISGPVPGADSCAAKGVVPPEATSAMVNVVAVSPQEAGNLRVAAAGEVAAGGVVNFSPGRTNSNAVPVRLSSDGRINVTVNAPGGRVAGDIRIIVLGYYTSAEPATALVPIVPCTILDTRFGTSFGSAVSGGASVTAQAAGTIGNSQTREDCAADAVPAAAQGVMVNVVAVAPVGGGNVQVSPSGTTPSGGVVNFQNGSTNSNAVPVALSASGEIDVSVNGGLGSSSHLRLVVLGYYL